jgi:hypothetical protein
LHQQTEQLAATTRATCTNSQSNVQQQPEQFAATNSNKQQQTEQIVPTNRAFQTKRAFHTDQ